MDLEVDHAGDGAGWVWTLRGADRALLARHAMTLSRGDIEATHLLSLHDSLWRVDDDTRRRQESLRAVLDSIGDFIGGHVLGDVARKLIELAPARVVVRVPRRAAEVLAVPLELTRVAGVGLADRGVVWRYWPSEADVAPQDNVTPLRMLAVFASPCSSEALSVTEERRTLVQTVGATGGGVQLKVVQYGANRAVLDDALDAIGGCDLLHISGHGHAGSLMLEGPTGGGAAIDGPALVELIRGRERQPRFVMLSACESAAARTARHGLALAQPASRTTAVELGSLGHQLVEAFGCPVVAMRYPVDDRFSVTLGAELYRSVLVDGVELETAFAHAAETASAGGDPLGRATAILFSAAQGIHLTAGVGEHLGLGQRIPRPSPTSIEHFVGRTSVLAWIGEALTSSVSGAPGSTLVLVGMPGVGKTATLAEVAGVLGSEFTEVIWHSCLPGENCYDVIRSVESYGVQGRRESGTGVLLLVDDAHHLLDANGRWRSASWDHAFHGRAGNTALRIVMTADRRLPDATDSTSRVLPLLTRSEAELLWRRIAIEPASSTMVPWKVCRGHPGLIVELGREAAPDAARAAGDLARQWEILTPSSPQTRAERLPLDARHLGTRIADWAQVRIRELDTAAMRFLTIVAGLEAADRQEDITEWLWPMIAERDPYPNLDAAELVSLLTASALMQRSDEGTLLLHPVVAETARSLADSDEVTVAGVMAHWWQALYEKSSAEGAEADWLADTAARAVPYLIRCSRWEAASTRTEQAIHHDSSPNMAARVLPFLNEIARATTEDPIGVAVRYVRATAVAHLDRDRGLIAMTKLYEAAKARRDHTMIVATATFIADLVVGASPRQALDKLQEAARSLNHLSDNSIAVVMLGLKSAKIDFAMTGDAERATATAMRLDEELAALIDATARGVPANLRSLAAELRTFATSIERRSPLHPRALSIGRIDSGADGQRDLIIEQFNAYSGAEQFNSGDTETVLKAVLQRVGGAGDESTRAMVLSVLADVRWARGGREDAVELSRRALRVDYRVLNAKAAARDHRQLATMAAATGDDQLAARHLLAGAVIDVRVSEGLFAFVRDYDVDAAAWSLKLLLARAAHLIPADYPQLQRQLKAELDLDLEALLVSSPRVPITTDSAREQISIHHDDDPGGDTLSDVIALGHLRPGPEELADPLTAPVHFSEILDFAATHRAAPNRQLTRLLGHLGAAGWTRLAQGIRALIADEPVPPDLDAIDTAIIEFAKERFTRRR